MNADALIGTVLGTSTLQQLIGQGGMGAVYLAQQSRPRRQVAVKVLMPATSLKPHQLSAFLERFRRETDAAASLEHPNIMPVYEYGERGGLAFLVMPYISAGTLRDVMERDGPMAFADAVNYIEQMAAALDFAHARGVIHRDIKPANMLLTPEGRLLLTDFGLVKLLSDNQTEQMRLTGAGAPVGTPDYMSPEQVIGSEVDGRSDQYALGVVLFQMLTGTTPFQGETPMQIASQQLHMQPPSPRSFRVDLPEAAEQVILRAMAKRSGDRYASAQEFSFAFRAAITNQSWQGNQSTSANNTGLLSKAGLRKGSLFDTKWQNTGSVPAFGASQINQAPMPMAPAAPVASLSTETEANAAMPRPAGAGLLSKTGLFPRIGDNTGTMAAAPKMETNAPTTTGLFSTNQFAASTGAQQAFPGGRQQDAFAQPTGLQQSLFTQSNTLQQSFSTGTFPTGTGTFQTNGFQTNGIQQLSPATQSTTSAMTLLNAEQKSGNTIKLTGPVKVVHVPVAPGQYVTGLLPIQQEMGNPPAGASETFTQASKLQKIMLIVVLLVVLIGGIGGGALFLRTRSGAGSPSSPGSTTTPNSSATSLAQATGTASNNIVFSDPLTQNIHNFQVDSQHFFKDGAYHIVNKGQGSVALVVDQPFTQPTLTYALTMQEVAGDDADPTNTFGLILRYNQSAKGVETFYTFEIRNQTGSSQYGFYKYDSSKKAPWTTILPTDITKPIKTGKEFKAGQGKNATNAVKVVMNGSSFIFYVNGQQVATAKDTSYAAGSMGMIVNLKGTEVAFSNMLITQN
jgi:serine/threonine protein kinase